MGPWEEGRECLGACVAWCDLFRVYAACMCVRVYVDMGIPMHALSYTCRSQINEEEETFRLYLRSCQVGAVLVK